MGRRTNAPVIFTVPIQQIVPPFVARAGKIADFVLRQAPLAQKFHHAEVHIAHRFLVGQIQRRRAAPTERRAFLYGQRIGGHMIGAQVAEFFQRVGKRFRRLVRDAEHHVGAEIRKARRPRRAEGFREIRKAVKPPERAQLARLRALQTHAQAVEAAFPQFDKIFGRDRSRVAFGCNLGILCHIVAGQNRCEKPAKHLRRAAAEVDRIHCIVAAVPRPRKEIALHRIGVSLHPLLRRVRNRAEIAVQAFAAAKRNMQIKSERRHTVTSFFLLGNTAQFRWHNHEVEFFVRRNKNSQAVAALQARILVKYDGKGASECATEDRGLRGIAFIIPQSGAVCKRKDRPRAVFSKQYLRHQECLVFCSIFAVSSISSPYP